MKIIWTPAAAQDRAQIWDYLHAANPKAAIDMDHRFSEAVCRISENPLIGRTGIVSGTREIIPHSSYRIVYQPEREGIWIMALVHTARVWPFPQ
jgi:toxin ParE1/3/4